MKKKLYIILVILLLSLLSFGSKIKDKDISTKKNVYKFELIKTLSLPLDEPITMSQYIFQLTEIDNKEIFIYYIPYSKIVFYDLNSKKKYSEITLEDNSNLNLKLNRLDNFKYISKDSIFLLYRPSKKILDSTQLVQIDIKGNVKKYYNFNNKYLLTKENKIKDDSSVIPTLVENRMEILNNNIFLFLNNPYLEIGSKKFMEKRLPCISNYDLSTQKLTTSEKLWYPYINNQTYYSSFFTTKFYCISKNGLPLIRFYYSSELFEWDYNLDEIKKYTLKSSLNDTIPPLTKGQTYYNWPKAMFKEIYYDPYRNLYYSYFNLNTSEDNELWSLIIADENLNYLSEIYNVNLGLQLIFTKDFIIGIDERYITDENGKEKYNINLNYYKLKKTEEDFDIYTKNIKKELLKNKM